MEEKVINMLEYIIKMQKDYQDKNDKHLEDVKNELRTEFKADIAGLRTEFKTDIAGLRTEFKTDIAELKTELKDDISELRTDVETLKTDMTEVKTDVKALKDSVEILNTDVDILKKQRMIDTNNLALVLNQQTKMLKILEDIQGNTGELNYVM